MVNTLDIIIIIFIIINLFFGWKKGLILSIFDLGGIIVSFFLTKRYFKKFSELLLKNVDWVKNLQNNMALKIQNTYIDDQEIISKIKDDNFLKELNLPSTLETKFNQLMINNDLSKMTNLDETLSKIIVEAIVHLVAFIVLFVLLLLIIKIIGLVINQLFQLPGLKGINQFGGLLFAFIKSNILIMVFMAIVVLLESLGVDIGIKNLINNSKIGRVYYHNNILLYLINYYL
ncbi:MAG: CvpA family protein [Bacillota bacterium]